MSWSITSKGRAKDVAAEVEANPQVPRPIKDLVNIIADGARTEQDGLEIVTHGHHGGKSEGCGTAEVSIKTFWMAPRKEEPDANEQPSSSDPAEATKKLS